jgi:hypothetical protein
MRVLGTSAANSLQSQEKALEKNNLRIAGERTKHDRFSVKSTISCTAKHLLNALFLFWLLGSAAAQDGDLAAKTNHRIYSGMQSGVVGTADGWVAKDFAASVMNPNSTEIVVTWKLTSDHPKYVFRDGSVGIWTGTRKVSPMHAESSNFYSPAATARYDPAVTNFPVTALTNFTGSVEFSSTLPFYLFSGHQFESVEGADDDPDMAWYKAWYPAGSDTVPASWDEDLAEFVIPYTNYWHNLKEY